ncbi:hypothetical protein K491DRAFT_710486 [Lophiostoma macrostomum CBS 122681]|uniref:Uncharacterized protein n=1 Tax=Lophiostoma macrostomum CBS 122681 TaxID=1314788 RepID=A0A6A6TSE1_9PLEO|nr:hypothetical protein K491DRAFT_710486 [Lophiostoma macrostomum CBS 122681]
MSRTPGDSNLTNDGDWQDKELLPFLLRRLPPNAGEGQIQQVGHGMAESWAFAHVILRVNNNPNLIDTFIEAILDPTFKGSHQFLLRCAHDNQRVVDIFSYHQARHGNLNLKERLQRIQAKINSRHGTGPGTATNAGLNQDVGGVQPRATGSTTFGASGSASAPNTPRHTHPSPFQPPPASPRTFGTPQTLQPTTYQPPATPRPSPATPGSVSRSGNRRSRREPEDNRGSSRYIASADKRFPGTDGACDEEPDEHDERDSGNGLQDEDDIF